MTTAEEGRTLTALDVLFGPDTDAARTLADEILSPGAGQELGRALAHLPEMTKKAAAQQAGTTVAALLKVDLTGVLVRGWREHRDIVSPHGGPWLHPAAPNWSEWPRTRSRWSNDPRSASWWTASRWPPSGSVCPSCSTSMRCC